jgi:PHD/YefM family antitoxin component YafN of YafNO toxin-antitoxin module
MTAYTANELIPSSEFAKRFGTYLSQITSNSIDKLAILKNNRVEAVLVSKEDYERMSEALEYVDSQEIASMIKERTAKTYKTISQEEMLKSLNIKPEELD